MGVEDLLDLTGIDVVATPDDQVLLAVDNEEEPVLIDRRYIAGVKPASAHHRLGRVLAVPVTAHDERPPHDDLAGLSSRDLLVLVIDHLHLHPSDRHADRARLAL